MAALRHLVILLLSYSIHMKWQAVSVTSGEDGPLTASAGPDVTLTLPQSAVTLNGSSSAGGMTTYKWTLQSAGLTADMMGTRTPTLHLQNLEAGIYTFRLTVTDAAGHTASDDVQVTVKQVLCAEPRLVNGWVQGNGLEEFPPGAFVYLHCDNGYSIQFDGEAYPFIQVLCGPDGHWLTAQGSNTMPTCQEKPCSSPPRIPSSSVQLLYGNTTVDASASSHMPQTSAHYICVKGFVLANPSQQELVCIGGDWVGSRPRCLESPATFCEPLPDISHGMLAFKLYGQQYPKNKGTSGKVPLGVKAYYQCEFGYQLSGDEVRECQDGMWTGSPVTCDLPTTRGCRQPPILQHGSYSLDSRAGYNVDTELVPEGSQVFYYCHNGYQLEDEADTDTLICRGGIWDGSIPRCIRRQHCDVPTDIEFGNWVIQDRSTAHDFSHYWLGTKILYECDEGYEPYGATLIECQTSGYWSDNPPKCLPTALYCPQPKSVEHGYYVCNPDGCGRFKVGIKIYFVCAQGYEPVGVVQQTCTEGGEWSSAQPVCLPIPTSTIEPGALTTFDSNTVMVVTATSCSVLGLLIIVIIIVAVQRRQPSPSLCHPVTPPPAAYPRPRTGSIDEHDRVALIAFADGYQAVLPTYEEATRVAAGRQRFTEAPRRVAPADFRPLPTIPPILRGRLAESQRPMAAPVSNQHGDSHRNSIITVTSTATRDNLSMAFGSIDTMNISDGTSTTVTIDTMESAASNPSLALSQRAVAGSIGSSHGSLADDDAPLLEEHNTNDSMSEDKNSEEKSGE